MPQGNRNGFPKPIILFHRAMGCINESSSLVEGDNELVSVNTVSGIYKRARWENTGAYLFCVLPDETGLDWVIR